MTSSPGIRRAFHVAVVAITLFTTGCGSSSSSSSSENGGTVNINAGALLTSISNSIQQQTDAALKGWDWTSFITSFGSLLSSASYDLEMRKVTYQSTGADGQLHSMTGLLILPQRSNSKPSVPILMYQHATETYRPFSPSQYLLHRDRPTDYPEVMVAAAIASTGYAVAMPDYEGMGDNTDPHPAVHGASLAQQVIDMLRASRDIITGSSAPCTWNSQLFLMGYSEGGYVTMVATRQLQLNHAAEFPVTASAPLSGPHDLSGTMRAVILSDAPFKAPYFVPFLLTGYNYAYGSVTNVFSPAFALKDPTIAALVNGNTRSEDISKAMGMSFSPVQLIVPKSSLTQQFIDQLASDTSQVVSILRENDSYRGWAPNVPMRMIHHREDDLVPFANSQVAFNAFSTAGAKQWVSLVAEPATISISDNPVQTVHFSAAVPELSNGWRWLDSFKQ
ncbi:lipase family protein [Geomonas sp. RF6]|uniref:lipase family protein n=1 Tax=Geomonas sp. RF6 TaxID=2897342 RepID=UPI001E385F76|nr:lipase family protein [Geomonas sp. RF6]UFS69496.1 lipase family protein [Geomonas sp. RF6]